MRRIVEAGVIPGWLIQKYLNKWISSSYDLFGTDHSSSAHWAYVWGIKGRYDEPKNEQAADLDDLNDYNRRLYRDEVAGLIARFNSYLKDQDSQSFTRHISSSTAISGAGRGRNFMPRPAKPWMIPRYAQHLQEYLPSADDKKLLLDIISNEKKWIAPKEGARDPLASIGEVRKSAINL